MELSIYLNFIDFENKDGRDAGKDIALEVERLKSTG
jgi:carboxyl-terminal processing protease